MSLLLQPNGYDKLSSQLLIKSEAWKITTEVWCPKTKDNAAYNFFLGNLKWSQIAMWHSIRAPMKILK